MSTYRTWHLACDMPHCLQSVPLGESRMGDGWDYAQQLGWTHTVTTSARGIVTATDRCPRCSEAAA